MAVSGILNSTSRNAAKVTAKVVSKPMILGADQGSVVPPHWRARMRLIMEGTKKRRPMGSSCLIWARIDSFSFGAEARCRKKKTAAKVTAPIGRLM
jgi:hypothetical protein